MGAIIQTNSLTKHFGAVTAVSGVSLSIGKGEIYGLLGLNGAGKTTLIRMLLGMIRPDEGSVMLFGKQVAAAFDSWNDVGYLVETPYAYPNLSVAENLKVFYHLRQLQRAVLIDEIIEQLKLSSFANTKARHLSMGNRQRLGLAKALMHRPQLLILDEPINGLDPEGIAEVRALMRALADNGTTILLSSHILSEIAKVANRIGIIHQGELIEELTVEQLNQRVVKKLIIETGNPALAVRLLTEAGYQQLNIQNGLIEITDAAALANSESVTTLLVKHGEPPKQLFFSMEDLEMFFLRTITTKTT